MSSAVGLRIGLTGGIGSGKSTVAQMLIAQGAVLVDTDAIARSLTDKGGAGIPPIRTAFGDAFIAPDGSLDRERMRHQAFADPAAKTRLEAILHPLIGAECERQAGQAAGRPIVFDVPLLVESGRWRARVDRVLVIDCREDVQVERVMRRAGWSREAVLAVIAQQASRESRRAAADAVIVNDDLSLAQLGEEVAALWRRWT